MFTELYQELGFIGSLSIVLFALVLLFLARMPFHKAIKSFTRIFYSGFKSAAKTVNHSEQRLSERNKEVLLALGREHSERMVEREFERVEDSLRSELSEYPAMHRKLNEHITELDEKYSQSTEVPPEPTGWSKAVESIAKVSTKVDPMLSNVMEDIHKSMKKSEAKALNSYRDSCKEKHVILKKMMPHWRKVKSNLGKVDKNIETLLKRGESIDRHMDDYNEIRQGSSKAVQMLSSSSMSQFFISLLVLLIAAGGAVINFNLIARPMAEMVGGTSMIGTFQVADIAALVIILVEISMGLFLMECLRITKLFPVIHALSDKIRLRLFWIALTILLLLACVEAGLAFMREILMQEDLAISALLRDSEVSNETTGVYWITTAAQMGMGFILPIALVFVAIPLENFISSLRTVLGLVLAFLLRAAAFLLRLIGNAFHHIGRFIIGLYDLIIFIPLWIEHLVQNLSKDEKNANSKNVKARTYKERTAS